MLEAKIARIRDQLRAAEIVEAADGDTAGMGSTVTYEDDGEEKPVHAGPGLRGGPGQGPAVDRLADGRGARRHPGGRHALARDSQGPARRTHHFDSQRLAIVSGRGKMAPPLAVQWTRDAPNPPGGAGDPRRLAGAGRAGEATLHGERHRGRRRRDLRRVLHAARRDRRRQQHGRRRRIDFDIPGAGPHTIAPSSQLPDITDRSPSTPPPGRRGRPRSHQGGLPRRNQHHRQFGLVLTAGASAVRGMAIGNFMSSGVALNSGNSTLEGNFLGTDATGLLDRGRRRGRLRALQRQPHRRPDGRAAKRDRGE